MPGEVLDPWLDDGDVKLYHGDAIAVLRSLPERSVQCCVTSPPYWGLRSYLPDGHDDKATELGLEATPDLYVANMVAVFREVWRVLRDDGTLWLNLGDSYANPPAGGLKQKDLCGIPWRVAFALQADGWYLRSDIIWAKPNPMPESVTDRPTKAHEYVFLLTKRPRYYFDADAIREPNGEWSARALEGRWERQTRNAAPERNNTTSREAAGRNYADMVNPAGRNARSVWEIATQPFPEAHFATYPEALVRRCILAGSRLGDTILDPFVGSGTTCLVARKHQRHAIGIDLSAEYLAIAARRLSQLSLLGAS